MSALSRARAALKGSKLRRPAGGALIGVAVGGAFAAAMHFGFLEKAELFTVDERFRIAGPRSKPSDDVVVLKIDDEVVEWMEDARHEDWPFSRQVWSDIVTDVAALKPKAIVLDVVFSDFKESSYLTEGDSPFDDPSVRAGHPLPLFNQQLGQSLCTAGNAVIGVHEQGDTRPDVAALRAHFGRWRAVVPYLEARVPPVRADAAVPSYPPDGPRSRPYLVYPEANILAGTRAVGLVNTTHVTDDDGVIRRFTPVVVIDSAAVADISVSAIAVAEKQRGPCANDWPPPSTPEVGLPRITAAGGRVSILGHDIPVDEKGRAWIRWRGDWLTTPGLEDHVESLKPILANDEALLAGGPTPGFDRSRFEGKIVFVGFTMQGDASDTSRSPFGVVPGVFTHASALDTILTGDYLRSVPRSVDLGLVLLLPILAGTLILGLPEIRAGAVQGVPFLGDVLHIAALLAPGILLIIGYTAACFVLFSTGWVLNLFHVMGATFLATTLAAGSGWLFQSGEAAEQQKKREQAVGLLTRTFGKDVASDLIEKVEAGAFQFGGERREMTLYFSDIAGFTSISENLPPEQLVNILNEYLTRVTELFINKHGAYVDKYIGDAVMASWGAPYEATDAPTRACLAALDAIEAMDAFSAELVKRGLSPLRTRIGINTGPAVAAWIGHPEHIAFTSLGDTVNLASRLEGANKHYGTVAMIGPQTYEGAKDVVLARELDLVKVKGKQIPVRVYELMARIDSAPPAKVEIKRRYEEALGQFRARNFARAREAFLALVNEFQDPPSKAMAAACEDYEANPPPDGWDGSSALHEK